MLMLNQAGFNPMFILIATHLHKVSLDSKTNDSAGSISALGHENDQDYKLGKPAPVSSAGPTDSVCGGIQKHPTLNPDSAVLTTKTFATSKPNSLEYFSEAHY